MDYLLPLIPVIILFNMVILSQMLTTIAQNPPRPVSRTRETIRKLAIEKGSTVFLPCPVENRERDDVLLIEWTKDGSSLSVLENRYRETSSGSLRIKDTQLTDSGMYTCLAINGFGAVEMTIQLIVFDKNAPPISSTSTSTTTTTTTTAIPIPEIERIDDDSPSNPVDPLDPLLSIDSFNLSQEPKILGSSKVDDIWSDKLTLPFVIASVGATFVVLVILLLLLSYVKLRSPINPKFNQVIDRTNDLFGAQNNLNHDSRLYNMYPLTSNTTSNSHINNNTNSNNANSTSNNNHLTSGQGSLFGLTTPSHHYHHHNIHSTPPRKPPLPPPPTIPLPHPLNQMTPAHFTIVSHNHSNELRTVPSDKASSPVDSSVIYESPLEFDLKPNFARKTPYGYLC